MARIAALIMERRCAVRFDAIKRRLRDVMALSEAHAVEEQGYASRETLCCLLRVGPDPVNRRVQPVRDGEWRGAMCGYYLPREPLPACDGNSAAALFADLAANGAEALRNGDGVFAYARWNETEAVLEAGVDKLGMRPLHWAAIGGGYVIASDLKAVIVAQDKPAASLPAWQERLAFSYPLGDHALVEGAARFAEAEVIRFSACGHRATTYEDFLGSITVQPYAIDAFIDEQQALFSAAMSKLTRLYDASRETMLTLSGGYDSRRILAWLLDAGIRPEAFTVPEVLEDGSEYESGIVRALCRRAGLSGWIVYPRTAADRAFARRCRDLIADFQSDEHLFCAALALALDGSRKANFDGIGGDMAVGALYIKERYLQPGGDAAFLQDFLPRSTDWLRPLARTDALRERCKTLLNRYGDTPNRFTYFLLSQRTRRKISLACHTYQSWAIESLCPYLDRAFLRQTLSLHPAEKLRISLQGRSIARFSNNFAGIPTTHDAPDELRAGYGTHFSRGGRREQNALLGQALRLGGSRPWRVPAAQKARFILTLFLGEAIGAQRAAWERNKANKIHQLTAFASSIETPETYLERVSALKDTIGTRKDFATPIE